MVVIGPSDLGKIYEEREVSWTMGRFILHEEVSPHMQKYLAVLLLVLPLVPSSVAVLGSKNQGPSPGNASI